MKKITIHNTNYYLISDFKDNTELRHSFNSLAQATYNFDFEDYYKSGYWNDRYIPYALLDDDRVVANVSVNVLDFFVCGEMKRYIQIGTVMTDMAYRNKGLCRYLLETVIAEWQDKSDLIYLFANDTVLDFYPKFGFVKILEHQYSKNITGNKSDDTIRHLNMDEAKNRELLFRLSDSTRPFFKLTALHNTGLVMFYATSFMKDDFYYIESLNAAVFAIYEESTLHINDIFCPQEISVEQVISAMAGHDINRVVLGFTPIESDEYCCTPHLQEDDTLFVLAQDESGFEADRLMFPILSHA